MLRICPSQKKFKKILFFMTKYFILKICVLLKKKNDVELMEAFLRYEFGGLTFGGAYFQNFAVFYSNTGLVLDLQWLLYSNIRTMKSIYTVPGKYCYYKNFLRCCTLVLEELEGIQTTSCHGKDEQ